MKLKRHVRYTKHGPSIGFTGASQLRRQPRVPVTENSVGITSGIEACAPVSWMARILYQLGQRKLARYV